MVAMVVVVGVPWAVEIFCVAVCVGSECAVAGVSVATWFDNDAVAVAASAGAASDFTAASLLMVSAVDASANGTAFEPNETGGKDDVLRPAG